MRYYHTDEDAELPYRDVIKTGGMAFLGHY